MDSAQLTLATRDVSRFTMLKDGAKIVSLDDISVKTLEGVDAVVHLAARVHQMKDSAREPLLEHRKINRDFTLKLASLAIRAGVSKFIFASTVKVMGEGKSIMNPLTEDDPLCPEDPYGVSKMEAEKGLSELFKKQSSSKAIIFRIPMVYGPGNKGNMLTLLKMASKKAPLPLGAIKNARRSMVYVGNLRSAIKSVIDDNDASRPSLQTYFVTDGHDLTSGELYSMISNEFSGKEGVFYLPLAILRMGGMFGSFIEKITGASLPLSKRVVSRLLDEYKFSSNAFRRDYNWTPPYTQETGIKETVEWFRNSLSLKVE